MDSRRSLLSAFKSHPSFSNFLAFKKQKAKSKRILRTEKRKGWKEFCSRLNPSTPISYLWRFVKRFKSRHFEAPIIPRPSNSIPSPSIQNVIDALCPPSVFNRAFSSINDLPTNHTCKIFDEPFTIQKLNSAIRNLKIHTSPGIDRVDNKMLSLLPEEYLHILLDIYNSIFDTGAFSDAWRHSLVYLIPKSSPGKLRPISLTLCLLKVFERIVAYRLGWWVQSSHILPPFQYGFRKRVSCLDNLGILSTEIHHGFVSKQVTSTLFLDVQGAFDNVIPSILTFYLIDIGLPPKLCWFIYQLICFRELQFVVDGCLTERLHSYKDVPQGSILNPF